MDFLHIISSPNLLFGVLCLPGDQSHPFTQPTINPLACCICWAGLLGRAVFPPWNEGPNSGSYKSARGLLPRRASCAQHAGDSSGGGALKSPPLLRPLPQPFALLLTVVSLTRVHLPNDRPHAVLVGLDSTRHCPAGTGRELAPGGPAFPGERAAGGTQLAHGKRQKPQLAHGSPRPHRPSCPLI